MPNSPASRLTTPTIALKLPSRTADGEGMTAVRWLVAGLLVWGLFTGIAYVLVPVVTDGWGNGVSLLAGLVLIGICAAGLLKLDPRRQ